MDPLDAKIKSVAEYSMECAITKVYGSETESYIVDEALQIHGGMGFSAESEISVHYRNVRGNRIYEGTNEINRILIPTMLLRKAMKGELPFMEAAMKGFQELQSGALKGAETGSNKYDLPMNFLKNIKKATLLVAGLAAQKFQQEIKDEQEVLMSMADMLSLLYIYESTLLRSIKHQNSSTSVVRAEMIEVLMYETAEKLLSATKEVIYASSEENQALPNLKAIQRLYQLPPANLKDKRRSIANYFINKNKYQL